MVEGATEVIASTGGWVRVAVGAVIGVKVGVDVGVAVGVAVGVVVSAPGSG